MKRIFLSIAAACIVLGCGAFVLITNPLVGTAGYRQNDRIVVSQERLFTDVQQLTQQPQSRSYEHPTALNAAADYIAAQFRASGGIVSEQKFNVNGQTYRNIICSFGPEDAERIIVGAHYDVCGDQPGADDNASGVAGLLELARLIAPTEESSDYRLDLVAYSLEEPPFFGSPNMGSFHHAASLKEQGVSVKAMICLEMIGYFSDEPNSQDYPAGVLGAAYPSVGNFIAVVGRVSDWALLRNFKAAMQANCEVDVYSINAPAIVPGVDFSDHRNYWHHGIPALMITDTAFYRNPHYHKQSDSIETLDFAKMAEVVRGVYWAISQMAS